MIQTVELLQINTRDHEITPSQISILHEINAEPREK